MPMLQSVDYNIVPFPSLLEVPLSSILKENLVAFLNVDRLVRDFLTQYRDVFILDGLFQQFRKILHSSFKITVISLE
jgi:hypothetical protein